MQKQLFILLAVTLPIIGSNRSHAHEEPTPIAEELAFAPSALPDRVVLTWSDDPATTQAVTWRTASNDVPALAEIQVATHGPLPDAATVVTAKSELLETNLGLSAYHSAEFTGLSPDTLYAYRIGDGVNWSEWFHFRTASLNAQPFSFIYVGDAQNNIKTHWSRLIREAIREAPRAAFTLHAGDLINNANNDAQWGEWFAAAGWVNASIPVVAAPGNHEYFKTTEKNGQEIRMINHHWRKQFTYPLDAPAGLEETCYAFDYQGVRFVVLNSNEGIDSQVEWLRKTLSNNPQKWTILTFHHPVFNPSARRNTAQGLSKSAVREAWKPIIDEFKVDLVLTGHDHTYARSGIKNIPLGYPASQDVINGTVYVVSVSGPKMYPSAHLEFMLSTAEDTQLYQVISIEGDTLRYEARTATNLLYDAFTLTKQPGTINALDEGLPNPVEFRRQPQEATSN